MIIKVILGGMSAGLIMTFMTGPAFFALIRTSIQKGFLSGALFALGVFMADAFFVTTTFLGASLIALAESNQKYIAVFGGLFIIGIGYKYLTKKVAQEEKEEDITVSSKLKNTGYFFKGLLMNLLNPGMLFYWIGLVSYLGTNSDYTNEDIKLFIFCSMITVLSTDLAKAYFASKVRHLFSNTVIQWMNRIVGTALIIFAIVMILKVYFF
jgi:threonine/homoserine/homoserine lactone efflux protein